MSSASHPEEPPLEVLVGLLEEGQEGFPHHTVEAYPKLLPCTLSLKKVEEDVHRRVEPQVVAQDCDRPYKRPIIGVQLSRGHVYFC